MTDEMTYQKMPKNAEKYVCNKCDFKTVKQSNFISHLATQKHKKRINTDEALIKMPKYNCICGKIYKHSQSLYNHKKKCNYNKSIVNNDCKEIIQIEENKEFKELKGLVVEVMKSNSELQKQNHELQKQMLEICKTGTNNSYTNSNNKTFNLQFFLNEQCKDAMNITDFINSVTLSLSDLENMGTSGYVNGISSIIIKELRGLDITKRPVHCSDAKRETLYIKDEDKWEKECPENTKMKTAIRTVEKKNIKLISEWTDKHPKFTNSTTKENDEYLQILIETMGGKGDYEKNKNKVIKNIAKEVVIAKDDI